MSITYGILYVAAVFHLVPFRIDEYVRPAHLHCHINILLYYLIVIGAMVVCPIYPRNRTWFNPRSVLYAARFTDISNERGSHNIFQFSNYNNPVGRTPFACGVLQILVHHHTKFLLVAVVVERRRAIVSFNSSLGNKCKDLVGWLKQCRIAPTLVFALSSGG